HTRWPRDWSSDVCSSDLLADRKQEDIDLLHRPADDDDMNRPKQGANHFPQVAVADPPLTVAAQKEHAHDGQDSAQPNPRDDSLRSEERRVGKEGRVRGMA